MSEADPLLEIFVIGGQLGESIVIKTPGGAFGVIDAYTPKNWLDPSANPTLARLRALGAERLRFVAMTHPHLDHFRGLPAIFQEYAGRIGQFWRPPFGGPDLYAIVSALLHEIEREEDGIRQEYLAGGGRIFRSLFDLAQQEHDEHGMKKFTLLNDGPLLNTGVMLQEGGDPDFSILCLGPSTDIVDPYLQGIIKKNFTNVLGDGPPTARAPHNVLSSVLAVRYGKWVGILGGDTERASWSDIIDRKSEWLAVAQFFKISHHGSPTGSYGELWSALNSDVCETVVTCFDHQRLPNEEGLRHPRERNFPVHSTNKALAERHYRGEARKPLTPDKKRPGEHGEIRIAVDKRGAVDIDYFGPAGLLDL
jgi:hypothetical protein